MSIKSKLITVVVLSSTGISIVVASIRMKKEGLDLIEQKSQAILSRMESIRNYVAGQGMQDELIEELAILNRFENENLKSIVDIDKKKQINCYAASIFKFKRWLFCLSRKSKKQSL